MLTRDGQAAGQVVVTKGSDAAHRGEGHQDRSGMGPIHDLSGRRAYVVNAAKNDVPIKQKVLPRAATNHHSTDII